jgi:adenylate cyclase
MSSYNRHAVIMFTDIAGYTALMGHDEKLALSILRRNKEIHQNLLKRYNGKWQKEMGDGIFFLEIPVTHPPKRIS